MWQFFCNGQSYHVPVAGLLTKKFVSLIEEAKDGTLDLNKTAEILEVQKMSFPLVMLI